MLKPFYSSVDILELEMANVPTEARQYNESLVKIRLDMINGKTGSKKVLIKSHLDYMVSVLCSSQMQIILRML